VRVGVATNNDDMGHSDDINWDIYVEFCLTTMLPSKKTTLFQYTSCIPVPMSYMKMSCNVSIKKPELKVLPYHKSAYAQLVKQ
jgi:hypothetical protein